MKVAIVGAGISGLAAAYELQKAGGFDVTLFERKSFVGGKIQTVLASPYLIEQGPDSVFSSKPWAEELMREIGLGAELIGPVSRGILGETEEFGEITLTLPSPSGRGFTAGGPPNLTAFTRSGEFSILQRGRLYTVPRMLASLDVSAPGALAGAEFLSEEERARALREPEITKDDSESDSGDESIASFFRRRFGQSFSELVAEPLLAGTHAGDPEKLSMAALYPGYVQMEREYGSITAGVAAKAKGTEGMRRPGFMTLRGGMGAFPRRLLEALTDVEVSVATDVTGLQRTSRSVTLDTSAGPFEADHVILATPADVAGRILTLSAPGAAAALHKIRFVSTAIVTLAFFRRAFDQPPEGNGFLTPFKEPCFLAGCTWSSNKWADRAPDDTLLMRAFIGRDGSGGRGGTPDVIGASDEDLIAETLATLASLFGPTGSPLFSRVDRWPNGLPQYEIGHLGLLASIERSLADWPISLIGSSYRGSGIPDCVRQGREAASRIISSVAV